MKRENQKPKAKKSEPKKPAPKQPAAEGSASQGTAGTIRRWVETLDRLSRSKAPLGIAIVLSQS